jgi:hypothetical protein
MLTADMKRVVREQRLGYVATVNADGTPNLSPKGTFAVVDDATIAFAELRSPGTLRNVRANPAIEVNVIDPFTRKGYRFAGTASVTARGAPGFDAVAGAFSDQGDLASRMRAVVTIAVATARPLTSPAYDRGATEAELRRLWTARFRQLQPNERFQE